jgi:hypothetical protein
MTGMGRWFSPGVHGRARRVWPGDILWLRRDISEVVRAESVGMQALLRQCHRVLTGHGFLGTVFVGFLRLALLGRWVEMDFGNCLFGFFFHQIEFRLHFVEKE